ncbi:MAG TPA: hypothetical protein VMV24_00540, partial [Candidatus Dormibacteraeota bacterium]|nr:hypothetical protein [Candidatus Dormibacteraeota bacterium]
MFTNIKYHSKQSVDNSEYKFDIKLIESASKNIAEVIIHTSLDYSERLSNLYNARIYLKREDLQST